ncbi:hypothetical protein GCM10012287_06140 [Streptomyces daqingensis]|uniref:Uncharacterized protein n=1 Tax=Streptomyces daqingensis TaxID=1472640 RepID=A0ABQ2LUM2_9ACTN|nr:hypothetical protein [Streptomyces daqingensis]GGO43298.1 hypothetical protein GCM10012287_06140 [Streptomyces daqingensis]
MSDSTGDQTSDPISEPTSDAGRPVAGAPAARRTPDGAIEVTAARYRMTVGADGLTARLRHHACGSEDAGPGAPDGAGHHPVLLQLPGALDRSGVPDETLSVSAPRLGTGPDGRPLVTVERRSTAWEQAVTRIECTPEGPQFRWEAAGSGALTTVLPFAARAALGGRGGGLRPSGHAWRTLFTPNPGPPRRLCRGAGESAVIGASGDARPGRGHWFFTPAPLCLALTEDGLPDDADPAGGPAPHGWWTLGAGAPVREMSFAEMAYVPSEGGFHLRLDYEGHTRVEGSFTTPALLVSPGHPDPYEGLRSHRRWLTARGWSADGAAAGASAAHPSRPGWWSEPMFCGWGAQSADAAGTAASTPDLSTAAHYDAYLARLAAHGLTPGTVVIDDKWQRSYGSWEPDTAKWPDLRGWIDERHSDGRKVLLWWRAWATDGVPDEMCVRTPDGRPVALDPDHPGARALLADNITRMLGPRGLGADGLKIDFTADTPSGACLTSHGPHWGIALLHRQLAIIYAAAKEAKPDALVITHTPHPAFADVTDMIRLNDMLRLDDPDPYAPVVPQMRQRAAVARASCPGLLLDTDDWCAPDREQWREYCAVKHELGVPALYVATHLDRTGEPLEEADYAAVGASWARWRAACGDGAFPGGREGPRG